MIVVDASVLVAFLVEPGMSAHVRAAFARHGDDLHAPAHVDLEVLSALRRLTAAGLLTAARATAAVEDFLDVPLVRHGVEGLTPRVWALHAHVSPYDAAYLALAEALGTAVLTCDGRLARAHGHAVPVEVVTH